MVVVLLAGCLGPQANPATARDAAASTPPAPLDIDAFLADYHAFVSSNPVRRDNVATHQGARSAILEWLTDAGLEVWRHAFTDGIPQENLIGVKWGADRTRWIVVAAHYDTIHLDCAAASLSGLPVPCPGHAASQGAYDNGSGTAIALDLARRFANATTHATLAFVFFDGEERGLQGSRAWLETMADEGTPWGPVDLELALVLDMFGLTWPGVDAPMHVYGTAPPVERAVERARVAIGVPDDMVVYGNIGPYAGGDDLSFVDADVPVAAFDSDFAYVGLPTSLDAPRIPGPIPTGAYPFFHVADTWETMTLAAGSQAGVAAGFTTALTVLGLVLTEPAG